MAQIALSKPSTTENFYQRVLLLEALDPIRGERSKSGTSDDATVDHPNVRRLFVDSIAYICAFKKGPRHVTAATLQQTTQGITIWLAGNKVVKEKVAEFLTQVINDLTRIARLDRGKVVDQAELLASGKLSHDIIKFLRHRLVVYYDKAVKDLIPQCLDIIDGALTKGTTEDTDIHRVTSLREWLNKFLQRDVDDPDGGELETLVRDCYDLKRSDQFTCFKLLGAQGQTGYKDFQELAKLLGKLGKPIVAARSFVTAAITLPSDFVEGFKIEILRSPAYRKVLLTQTLTIEEVACKVFTVQDERKKYLDRLRKLTNEESVSAILTKKYKLKTCVHAELLLLNHFYKEGYEFAVRDKYIACSKHACYLCHAYIKHHPGNFTPPPTHHKIYKCWRAPNAESKDPILLALDDEILQLVSRQIQRDLLVEVESHKPRRSLRADSPPS